MELLSNLHVDRPNALVVGPSTTLVMYLVGMDIDFWLALQNLFHLANLPSELRVLGPEVDASMSAFIIYL